MRAENYIFKGTFFRQRPQNQDEVSSLGDLQLLIERYFTKKGYQDTSPSSFPTKYFEQEFLIMNIPKISKFKKFFGQSERTQYSKQHMADLRQTRQDYPGEIKVHVYPGKFDNLEGFFIDITSKCIKYLRIVQLNDTPEISEQQYSFIVTENIDFLTSFAKANLCKIIKTPTPMNILAKTEASEQLIKYKFNRLGKLLIEARGKLEIGKDKEALDDLIGLIENFFSELLEKLGEKPKPLHNLEANILLLGDKDYLPCNIAGIIKGIMLNNVYLVLKKPAHERSHFDLFDLRYMFDITEKTLCYVLEKVWVYKIKPTNNSKNPKPQPIKEDTKKLEVKS